MFVGHIPDKRLVFIYIYIKNFQNSIINNPLKTLAINLKTLLQTRYTGDK